MKSAMNKQPQQRDGRSRLWEGGGGLGLDSRVQGLSGLVFSAQGVKRSGIGGLQKIFARINAYTPSSSLLLILGSNINIMALIWGNHTAQQLSQPLQKSQQLLQDSSGKRSSRIYGHPCDREGHSSGAISLYTES